MARISAPLLQEITHRLVDEFQPEEIILFGSYARDAAEPSSDIDFLVVEPNLDDRIRETARLRIAVHSVLGRFMIPVDILVLSTAEFERLRHAPNTIYHHAAKEGLVHERIA